ncbi:MAG: hypothetical protein PVG79_11855 [Gemmatimonadales bacterium]|jgi:probable HAF family extracellular repeat protein
MKRLLLLPLVALLFAGCEKPTEPENATVAPAFQLIGVAQDYEPIDLGTLGGDQSWAYDINRHGQVVGWSETADGDLHAFLWEKGKITDLSPGKPDARAKAINDRGQVVGQSGSPGNTVPVLWENGEMTVLGTQVGGVSALDINNRGQVVVTRQDGCCTKFAFLWENGEEIDLGDPWGGNWVGPKKINERGQMVGSSRGLAGPYLRAFLWEDGVMTELRPLPTGPPGNTSHAMAINYRGQVVGFCHFTRHPNLWHAVLWEDGEIIDLGGYPESEYTFASDINIHGQVVGYSRYRPDQGVENRHALLWEDLVMTELSTLGGEFSEARSINNRGQIVGSSQTGDGHYRATLWTR